MIDCECVGEQSRKGTTAVSVNWVEISRVYSINCIL